MRFDPDAGAPRRLDRAADGVDRPAPPGAGEREVHDDDEDEEEQEHDADAAVERFRYQARSEQEDEQRAAAQRDLAVALTHEVRRRAALRAPGERPRVRADGEHDDDIRRPRPAGTSAGANCTIHESNGRLIEPVSPSTHSCSPRNPSRPASVITKLGTPEARVQEAVEQADQAADRDGGEQRERRAAIAARTNATASTAAASPDTEPTERSISPSEQHEHDAERDRADRRALHREVDEVAAREEHRVERLEHASRSRPARRSRARSRDRRRGCARAGARTRRGCPAG